MTRARQRELQRPIASLLLELALVLEWPARRTAIALYALIERVFGTSSDPPVQRTVAQALVSGGLALGQLHRREEGIAICDRLVELFGQSADPVLRARVAWAMVNKGCFLQELGRDREAVALYEEVHRRFAHAPEATAIYAVGRRNMWIALSRLGRTSEAAEIRRQLARLSDSSADPEAGIWGVRTIPIAAAAAAAWSVSSWISIVVYRAIPQMHPSWLVSPVLYVNHHEHSQLFVGAPLSRFTLMAYVGVLAAITVRWVIRLRFWVRIAFGIVFGGALANAFEYGVVGSVTDFIGIRALGIWSVGDICILLGLFAIGATGMVRPEALARGAKRRHLLIEVLSLAIVGTVISGSLVWVALAALVCAIGIVGALAALALPLTRRRIVGHLH